MNKLTGKKLLHPILLGFLISLILLGGLYFRSHNQQPDKTVTLTTKTLTSAVLADGNVNSADEQNLHFITGGFVTYLPHREGDFVNQGETIAALDTRQLSANLEQAKNNLRFAQATVDKILDDIHLFQYGNGGFANVGTANETETQRQQRTNAEAARDNAQEAVKAAQAAFTNAVLVSPQSGTLIHSDISTPNVNVGPSNTFTIANMDALVFHALVSDKDIDFIRVGQQAKILLSGKEDKPLNGSVSKIFAGKTTLPSGESVYKVEMAAEGLQAAAKFGQSGTVSIQADRKQASVLIPSWLVLGQNKVWVMEGGGRPVLKTVSTGRTIGFSTEILGGLDNKDQIVLNPKSIVQKKYFIF